MEQPYSTLLYLIDLEDEEIIEMIEYGELEELCAMISIEISMLNNPSPNMYKC